MSLRRCALEITAVEIDRVCQCTNERDVVNGAWKTDLGDEFDPVDGHL